MPWSSFADSLSRIAEKISRAYEIQTQAAAARKWVNRGQFPGVALNPIGIEYERERQRHPSVRPTTFTPPRAPNELASIAQGFAPQIGSPESQAVGFTPGITTPEQFQQGLTAAGAQAARGFQQALGDDPLARQGVTDIAELVASRGGPSQQQFSANPQAFAPDLRALADRRIIEQQGLGGLANPALQAARETAFTAPFASPELLASGQAIQQQTAGANFNLPQAVFAADRAIAEFAAPVTEPIGLGVGSTLARAAVAPAQPFRVAGEQLDIPGLRSIPSLSEAAAAVAPASRIAGKEILNPTNLVPIPIVDPLAARLLGLLGKAGARVARPVLERLAARASRLAADTTEPIAKEALREAAEVLARGGAPEGVTTSALPERAIAEAPTGAVPARAGEPVSPKAVISPDDNQRTAIIKTARVWGLNVADDAPFSGNTTDLSLIERIDAAKKAWRDLRAKMSPGLSDAELDGMLAKENARRLGLPAPAQPTTPLREGAVPARAGVVADGALRAIAEERRIVKDLLADPATRRLQGETERLRTQLESLDIQEEVVRSWEGRNLTPAQQADELAQLEDDFLGRDAAAVRGRGGRAPAFGTQERSLFEETSRKRIPPSRRPIRQAPSAAEGDAIDELATRIPGEPTTPLREGAVTPASAVPEGAAAPSPARPDEVTGGAPFTPEEAVTPPKDTTPSAIDRAKDILHKAGPGTSARRSVQEYSGQIRLGNLDTRNWGVEAYKVAEDAGVPIVESAGLKRQSQEAITFMERIWGHINETTGRTARAPIKAFKPEERPLAQFLFDKLDEIEQRILAADPEWADNMLEAYWPHFFDTASNAPSGGTLRTRVTGRRTLEGALSDVLGEGKDLKSWDVVDFVKRHEAAANNYIASLDAIRDLKSQGLIVSNAPNVKVQPPTSYREINLPQFVGRGKLQNLVAEPRVATAIERAFGQNVFDQNGMLKTAEALRSNLFKMKVALGLFQMIDFSQRAIGMGSAEALRAITTLNPKAAKGAVRSWASPLKAIARASVPGLDARLTKLAGENPNLRALYKWDLGVDIDPGIGEKAISGLGGVVPTSVGGKQIPGARGLQQVVEYMTGTAYRLFHTEILEQAGLTLMVKHRKAGKSLDEAARLAAEEANVFFSSIPNWQSAVSSPSVRTSIKFPLFSVVELEGLLRMPFQAPASTAGVIGTTAIFAQMLSKLFTDEWLRPDQLLPYQSDVEGFGDLISEKAIPDFKGGKEAFGFIPVPGYNTQFLRPQLPWKGPNGELQFLDLLGQMDTIFRFAFDPQFAVETRLGQFPRAAVDINRIRQGEAPAFGEVVKTPGDFAEFALQQASPIAFQSLLGTEKGRIGAGGTILQTTGVNVSSEALTDQLARRWEENTGRSFDRERGSADWVTASRLPEYEDIFDRMQSRGEATGSDVAEARNEQAEFTAQSAERVGLNRLGPDMLQGDPDASQQFLVRYDDVRNDHYATLAKQFMGNDYEPEGESGKLLQELRDLNPFDERYEDPDTREPNWDVYFRDRDRLISKIDKIAPGFEEVYVTQPILGDDLAEAEQKVMDAKRLHGDLFDIQKYQGISVDQQEDMLDLRAAAERWRRDNPIAPGRLPSVLEGLNQANLTGDFSSRAYNDALTLRSSKTARALITQQYVDFLDEHMDVLEPFYPSLYPGFIHQRIGR